MRHLASVRKITGIVPIEKADAICGYQIDGWVVVDRKGAYNVGDLVVFVEVDSWIPQYLAPFLSKGSEPKEYNGVLGNRLRSIKLRGQISQGLILPLEVLFEQKYTEGTDVTDYLNIQKWEPPISAQLSGIAKGAFPAHLFPKTDAERFQNLVEELEAIRSSVEFEVTYKLDGTSLSVYRLQADPCDTAEIGVCSRNLELLTTDENTCLYVDVPRKCGLLQALTTDRFHGSYAIQGEIIGPGVQSNREQQKEHSINVFSVYDIDNQQFFPPEKTRQFVNKIRRCLGHDVVRSVPVLHENITIDVLIGQDTPLVSGLLAFADKKAFYNPQTPVEGFVFKSANGGFSFKVINNRYLLKYEDA